ncbi:hypothetical protein CGMCC3_g18116 [Colletotrichum fructicola]|uniref:Uncharacterized protein n=1 Tax=Colletotrichum fructicola (strain Nara gc5) TaxID=1213859 RepID=A0A7J6IEJ9_COLFN|nr:uncharacterized protein CGMCC3_g18116 [Colletotrichum fructicola]KAE9565699.1 hypothetical protein CGMCC3_g18116 [Colletotrichum fructicola]KAF4474840.1 hypothetical protein CGGC5_v016049 [Colletotrichum fructicola Nara gc5]KAF4487495.1 hypothetical protein CGGC5_v005922 [Colletotrichum fructicola Nara gc5]
MRPRLNSGLGTIGISLPLLYISGSTWQLLFAVNKPDRVELLHAHRFEGTRTIMGGSQILALLPVAMVEQTSLPVYHRMEMWRNVVETDTRVGNGEQLFRTITTSMHNSEVDATCSE